MLGGGPEEVLSVLLGRWAAGPSARLAALIEAVGRWASAGLPPLEPKTLKEGETLWLATDSGGRHVDVDRLGAALSGCNKKVLRGRLDAVMRRPPDPRWTPHLLGLATPEQRLDTQTWRTWRKAAGHGRDQRLRAGLSAVRAGFAVGAVAQPDLAGWYGTVIGDLEAFEAKFAVADGGDPDHETFEREVQALIAAAPPDVDTLLAPPAPSIVDELYQAALAGGDRDTIAVWADALNEAGDPWGVVVALQLKAETAPLSDAEEVQLRKLLKAHAPRQLGPLTAIIDRKSFRFHRGLLDMAHVKARGAAEKALLTHPAFRSVRTLQSTTEHLLDPQLHRLERVGLQLRDWALAAFPPQSHFGLPAPDVSQLAALSDQDRPLGVVAMAVQVERETSIDRLTGLPGLPALIELHVFQHNYEIPLLLHAPLMGRLRRLILEGRYGSGPVGHLWTTLRRAGAEHPQELVALRTVSHDGIRVSERDGALRVDVYAPFHFTGAELEGLPPVDQLVFHHEFPQHPLPRYTEALHGMASEVTHLGKDGQPL